MLSVLHSAEGPRAIDAAVTVGHQLAAWEPPSPAPPAPRRRRHVSHRALAHQLLLPHVPWDPQVPGSPLTGARRARRLGGGRALRDAARKAQLALPGFEPSPVRPATALRGVDAPPAPPPVLLDPPTEAAPILLEPPPPAPPVLLEPPPPAPPPIVLDPPTPRRPMPPTPTGWTPTIRVGAPVSAPAPAQRALPVLPEHVQNLDDLIRCTPKAGAILSVASCRAFQQEAERRERARVASQRPRAPSAYEAARPVSTLFECRDCALGRIVTAKWRFRSAAHSYLNSKRKSARRG